jgi:hypothetical protein
MREDQQQQQQQQLEEDSAWGAQQREQGYFRQFMQDNDPNSNNQGSGNDANNSSSVARMPNNRRRRTDRHSMPNVASLPGVGVGIMEEGSNSTSTSDQKPPARYTEGGETAEGVGIEEPAPLRAPYGAMMRQENRRLQQQQQQQHTSSNQYQQQLPSQHHRRPTRNPSSSQRSSTRHSIASIMEIKQHVLPEPYSAPPIRPTETPIEPKLPPSRLGRRFLTQKKKTRTRFGQGIVEHVSRRAKKQNECALSQLWD